MKSEHRKERTLAARDNLASAMRVVAQSSRQLQEVAKAGSKSELLDAIRAWADAVRQGEQAKVLCTELLGEEVEQWMKEG